jgi:transposase
MSLQANWNAEIPIDTARVGNEILDVDDPYRLVGETVNDFLNLKVFAYLYHVVGRGAICPIILSLVTVFQFLENKPDRAAARCAVTSIDWKYALHVPLTWRGFHFSDLSNFRQRLLEHEAERLVFDQVLTWIRSLGFAKKCGKQRSDSSHILGCVERLSRLELAWETLRVALRAVSTAAPGWYEQVIPTAFHKAYVERRSDWRLSKEEAATEMKQTGVDGFWFLDHLTHSAPQHVRSVSEVKTLRTVWQQQFERQEDAKKVIVRQPPIKGKDIIQSPHDPAARWAEKRGQDWVGYKQQVTETAEDEEARFVTDIDVVAANDGDSEVIDDIQNRLIARGLRPEEHYVDRGYVSGPNLAHSAARDIELVGPALADTSRKPEGYKLSDFDIDFVAQQATCPEGCLSQSWQPYHQQRDNQDRVEVLFGAQCQHCPARSLCGPREKGRKLSFGASYPYLRQRRVEQETEAFKERMKRRSGVEGTISELTRKHGARRARYRGTDKVRLQMLFTGTAVNLKRLYRALQAQTREVARERAHG